MSVQKGKKIVQVGNLVAVQRTIAEAVIQMNRKCQNIYRAVGFPFISFFPLEIKSFTPSSM